MPHGSMGSHAISATPASLMFIAAFSSRHTTGSRMAADETIAPSIITRTMRHSVAQTTERYKHIDEQLRLEALNKL
mgnify:FL=1